MARLTLENGNTLTQIEEIRKYLSPLKIELASWPIEKSEKVGDLLTAEKLDDVGKENLLRELDFRFNEQKQTYGYQSRDLVVLYPELPNLEQLLKMFDRCHKHDDDEVRYIVDGSGIFGFVLPNGEQTTLRVEAEEYIRVPALTEHWFVLDENRRIKAIRYFTSKEGWVARYTETQVRV